jgi:tetratricopeptide (TPR) repeat protein
VDAPEGTLIFIRDAAVRRHAVAKEPKSTVLAVGGPRDEAFHPSAWELWFAARPHAEAGEYDKAAQLVAAGMPDHPDNPSLLYNLGCFEALAGDHDAATAHVQQALELNPELREHAAGDPDLDSIRDRLL